MENIPIQDLPRGCIELLRKAVEQISVDPVARPQEFFFVLQAKHMATLAEEILFLQTQGYTSASPSIAHVIYESLFKLGFVLKHPKRSREILLREFERGLVQSNFPGERPNNLKALRTKPEYGLGKLSITGGQ